MSNESVEFYIVNGWLDGYIDMCGDENFFWNFKILSNFPGDSQNFILVLNSYENLQCYFNGELLLLKNQTLNNHQRT